jgi:hypothetical protein
LSDLPVMDGISLWPSLSQNTESPRNLMLHNIDDTRHIAAVRVGDWKLMKGLVIFKYRSTNFDPTISKSDFKMTLKSDGKLFELKVHQ